MLRYQIKGQMTNKILFQGLNYNDLYQLNSFYKRSFNITLAFSIFISQSSTSQHRLGHPFTTILFQLEHVILELCIPSFTSICNTTKVAKSHRLSFAIPNTHSKNVLELIHTDVLGPFSVISAQSIKIFILFVDDYSHFLLGFSSMMQLSTFSNFKQYVETQISTKIKILRIDEGKEYYIKSVQAFLTLWYSTSIFMSLHTATKQCCRAQTLAYS